MALAPFYGVVLLIAAFVVPAGLLSLRKRHMVLAARIAGGVGFFAIFVGAVFFVVSFAAAMALH